MATRHEWTPTGLRLICETSKRALPKALPSPIVVPNFGLRGSTLAQATLETVAASGRNGVRVSMLGAEALPTSGPWTLYHASYETAPAVMPWRGINLGVTSRVDYLISEPQAGATHRFYLSDESVSYPEFTAAVPNDLLTGITTPGGATQAGVTAAQAAAALDATTKANAAQSAAIAAAAADATAKRVLAEAYADGIVTDEENARIAAASTASTAANAYADLKRIEAEAYADGIVSDEEARAIADATAKANAAQAAAVSAAALDATAKANAAKAAAEAAAALDATAKRVLAEAYADGVVDAEESARIAAASSAATAANAYADLKKTEAAAYADGIVDAEETRAIADALARYNAAAALANNAATLARDNNLIKNGNSEMVSQSGMEAAGVQTSNPYSGSKCVRVDAPTSGVPVYTKKAEFPCNSGDQFYAEGMVDVTSATSGWIDFTFLNAAGGQVGSSTTTVSTTGSYTKIYGTFTAPVGAVTCAVYCAVQGSAATKAGYFDNLYAERKQQAAIDAGNAASTAAGAAAYADALARSPHNLIKNSLSNVLPTPSGPDGAAVWLEGAAFCPSGSLYGRELNVTTGTSAYITPLIPCAAGDQFLYYALVMTLTRSGYLTVTWYDTAGGPLAQTYINIPANNGYFKKYTVDATAPAGAGFAAFRIESSSGTGWVVFDSIYACRKISAGMLEADLAVVGVIRDPNFIPGSAGNAPTGFKLSGAAFPSTLKDGSTISTNFEVGRSSNMGGVEVGKTLDRTWLAYNRIANGYFYKSMAGWASGMDWSALSYTAGTGSAVLTVTSDLDLIDGAAIGQSIITPPLQTGQTVNLTLRTGWATTSSTGETGNSVKASIINLATGVTTLLGTWYYTHNGQALAWTLRTVDITSIVSAGGEFGIEIVGSTVGFPQPPGTSRTCSIHIDEVKIIL